MAADRVLVDCGELEVAVRDAVKAALRGETAAISRLPAKVQAEAQRRYNERLQDEQRAALEQQRRSPVHADPTSSLH